jgi:HAD superfamily hydrolase (TIGR01509 family)
MNPDKLQAIFFDVDDTLYDRTLSQRMVLEMLVKQFPRVFGELEFWKILEAWEASDRLAVVDFYSGVPSEGMRDTRSRRFLNLLGLPEDCAPAITAYYVREYPSLNVPVEGAIPLIKALCGQIKLGVITNSLPDVQNRKIDILGLRALLGCIVMSEEFGIRKPDSRIFRHAAGLLEVPVSGCLYVGDSFASDIIGAKQAGMLACWFNPGNTQPVVTPVKPDFTINKLEELPSLLRSKGLL